MDINSIPGIFPDDTARVRSTDPLTSHTAADRSKKRGLVKVAIERVLAASSEPLTADAIYTKLRNDHGFYCSRERVRTVLNEGAGLSKRESVRFDSFVRLPETGVSDLGNPAHLWALKEAA